MGIEAVNTRCPKCKEMQPFDVTYPADPRCKAYGVCRGCKEAWFLDDLERLSCSSDGSDLLRRVEDLEKTVAGMLSVESMKRGIKNVIDREADKLESKAEYEASQRLKCPNCGSTMGLTFTMPDGGRGYTRGECDSCGCAWLLTDGGRVEVIHTNSSQTRSRPYGHACRFRYRNVRKCQKCGHDSAFVTLAHREEDQIVARLECCSCETVTPWKACTFDEALRLVVTDEDPPEGWGD